MIVDAKFVVERVDQRIGPLGTSQPIVVVVEGSRWIVGAARHRSTDGAGRNRDAIEEDASGAARSSRVRIVQLVVSEHDVVLDTRRQRRRRGDNARNYSC